MNQLLMKANIRHRIAPLTLLMILVLSGMSGFLTYIEMSDRGVSLEWILMMLFFFGLPVTALLIGYLSKDGVARRSSLELYDDMLCGNLSSATGNVTSFRIPLDQITSVSVKHTDVLVIRSVKGNYKVKDVRNAQAFAQSVMVQTERYRAMLQPPQPQAYLPQQPAFIPQTADIPVYTEQEMAEAGRLAVQAGMAAAEQNTMQRMQTLEHLRVDGLITQEDYDQKKSELLAQI